jgi:hypothetical protein
MDAELLELQRQLEAAQSAKSSVRLSERNVVELVQKLQERGIIDFDLLHTVSGKEYITSVRPPCPSSISLFVPSTFVSVAAASPNPVKTIAPSSLI